MEYYAILILAPFDPSFLELLEEKELIRVKWSGSSNFVAFATDEGIRVAELGPRRVEDERIDTVVG